MKHSKYDDIITIESDEKYAERLQKHAFALAEEAGTKLFHYRRGLIPLLSSTAIFSNHPYKNPRWREFELERLRRRLYELGCIVVAEASYPPAGEPDAGYTVVLLVEDPTDGFEMNDLIEDALLGSLLTPSEMLEMEAN